MKYLIFVLAITAVILIKAFQVNTADIHQQEIEYAEDTLLFPPILPAGEVIQNKDSEFPDTKRFDQSIERFMKKWEIKGASFAMMKDGKLIYAKGYGLADAENNDSTEVKHLFRIASISKLITATGIMKLMETGQLSLNDKVFGPEGILNDSIYSDIKDPRAKQITVDHLLRHQGGFTNRYGDPMFFPVSIAKQMDVPAPADLSTIIRFVLSRRLGFTPGHASAYSNVGYGILSQVIEKVSGMDYESYIRKNILLPAGCFDMYLGKNLYEERFPNEVRYYQAAREDLIPCCDGSGKMVPKYYGGNHIEALAGAGAWIASPVELLRFLAVIDRDSVVPDILRPETIDLMTASDASRSPIGWMYTTDSGNWVRTGTLAGTSAIMKKQSNGYAWVFITNTSAWKGSKFPRYIDRQIAQAMSVTTQWPENDLFNLQMNYPGKDIAMRNSGGVGNTGL